MSNSLSRLNSATHGFRSAVVPLPKETEAYQAFEADIVGALAPCDAFEEELCLRIVALCWRLRRHAHWEALTVAALAKREQAADGEELAIRRLTVRGDALGGETQDRADRLERSLQAQLIAMIATLKKWREDTEAL
jgi:hypothetical protein